MSAYVTSTGSFLPGPPVGNDEIEQILGLRRGQAEPAEGEDPQGQRHPDAPLRDRPLLSGRRIRTRRWPLRAAQACWTASPLPVSSVGMLSCATTQGDLVIPGFGSMVQAGSGIPEVELHTAHGICSSSVMAMRGGRQHAASRRP